MKLPFRGAIDCDLHPAMPGAPALLSYLDEYWRDQIVDRHIESTASFSPAIRPTRR